MRIKFLSICSTLFIALSLCAAAQANQTHVVNTQVVNVAYAPSDIFSGANTFISFANDYANARLADSGLNVNNAITLLGYTKNWTVDAGYFSGFLQNDDSQDVDSIQLDYSRGHEAFLSTISKVSLYGKDDFVNYAVSSVSRSIEVGPEPETYSMMFAGLILMAFVARRRTI